MTKKIHLYLLTLFLSLFTSITNISTAFALSDDIQRVTIDFTMPNGYVRHLLLGFTPDNAATDGVDYGYDALNIDNYPYDLNWIIDNNRYVIQGVGAFDINKRYPLGLFLRDSGNIKIDLKSTFGFETPIDIYVYDSLLDTYTKITESSYSNNMEGGEYTDRFYIAFKDENNSNNFAKSLSTDEENLQKTNIFYFSSTKELSINTNSSSQIKNIMVYNALGQSIWSLKGVNSNHIKVPLYLNQTKYGIVKVETNDGNLSSKVIILN